MPEEHELSKSQAPEDQEAGQERALPEEDLRARLEEAERERSQFKSLAQRAQADLDNFRRRTEREREDTYRNMVERTMRNLLPIVDDLQLALKHVPANAGDDAWIEGIRLIERRLLALLEGEGVTPIEAEGKPFDPWEHEALFTIPTMEKEPGTVVNVIRSGYKLNDRVLRPAQVSVTEAPQQPQGNAPQESSES